jgi:hypothetical protein
LPQRQGGKRFSRSLGAAARKEKRRQCLAPSRTGPASCMLRIHPACGGAAGDGICPAHAGNFPCNAFGNAIKMNMCKFNLVLHFYLKINFDRFSQYASTNGFL